MTDTDITPAERLALYRSNHRIEPVGNGYTGGARCKHDGIRVLQRLDRKWRHHPDDILKLLEEEYGGPWGMPKAAGPRFSDR